MMVRGRMSSLPLGLAGVMGWCGRLLKALTALVFYMALVAVTLYLLCNVARVIWVERELQPLLFALALAGPLLSLALAEACMFLLREAQYRWHMMISTVLLVVVLSLIYAY